MAAGQTPLALAADALRRCERSRAELSEWLARRGVEPEDAEDAIARLEELGELDDERFARRYAEDKRELRGWGPERIRGALAARGLGSAEIDTALAGDGHAEQLRRAGELLHGRSEELDSDAARARALAFLARRGYNYELAYEAVRQVHRAA